MRAASQPIARAGYRAAMRAANAGIGRWGNKLQVTAVATDAAMSRVSGARRDAA
jgi:hypothetical protein